MVFPVARLVPRTEVSDRCTSLYSGPAHRRIPGQWNPDWPARCKMGGEATVLQIEREGRLKYLVFETN
jgi:hypothetical protein